MILEDFRDFFASSPTSVQQDIVSSLLALSTEGAPLKDKGGGALGRPHCQGREIRANGRPKGVRRYVRKMCGKNFSETTGKFWYNIKKKDKVSKYLYCLLSGYGIRKSARESGIESLQSRH